tara:strand:+ start:62 stop:472 length:411 start_codon:yes stop_codon:yes gene_type:complete
MDDFNKLVLHIATIVFIIVLAIVGIILYYSVRNSTFPPYTTDCPTYYRLDSSGNNCIPNSEAYPSGIVYPSNANVSPDAPTSCTNVPVTTFIQKGYTDSDILCKKSQWATNCGVYWDGVTNNSDACSKYTNALFTS